jgi:hypothetical protein
MSPVLGPAVFTVFCTAGLACGTHTVRADAGFAGRWEGTIEVPGAAQELVIDLERDGAGAWSGSAILPGRGIKGAPLQGLRAEGESLRLDLSAAMPYPPATPPELEMHREGEDGLRGEMRFEGLLAAVSLQRTGAAQVDHPPASRPIAAALSGTWTGGYELFGQPRRVSLRLEEQGARMTIVGQRTTEVVFALRQHHGTQLVLSGNDYDIAFEGTADAERGLIDGVFLQGPFELPLRLQRAPGAK